MIDRTRVPKKDWEGLEGASCELPPGGVNECPLEFSDIPPAAAPRGVCSELSLQCGDDAGALAPNEPPVAAPLGVCSEPPSCRLETAVWSKEPFRSESSIDGESRAESSEFGIDHELRTKKLLANRRWRPPTQPSAVLLPPRPIVFWIPPKGLPPPYEPCSSGWCGN